MSQPCSSLPLVAATLPRELKGFRNFHAGETIVVCGCGISLQTLVNPARFTTIGVNDVGRMFNPDYLVVVNPRSQFHADRFCHVEQSQARAIFTQLDLGLRHPHVVRFPLGTRGGTDLSSGKSLDYTNNSPYVALCLAMLMGARKVGVIGVDFTNDHFFSQTGQHPLERQLPQIDREYKRLYDACRRAGAEVYNLSANSRLTAFPKLSLAEFEDREKPKSGLRIVSYATTPVAGVPVILSRAITARTRHACRTVWANNSYGNGVVFDGDVEWDRAPSEAENMLRSADLVIAHNGKVDPRHQALLAGKPVITMAHNYMWNVDCRFVQQGFPGVVVGQYQATLPEFKQWRPVPNPVPLWEPAFQTSCKQPPVTICYTPSGKHETYPAGHRLHWHSKGYATTIKVLERLARRFPINLEVVTGNQVAHSESLAMKRRAHIVIDECVTGSYHRNSLEGLALGCVVVNGTGSLPAIADMFCHCAETRDVPFVKAGLSDLESVLTSLIEGGAESLTAEGVRNRAWMQEHWNFDRQWERFWEPVIALALERSAPNKLQVSIPHEVTSGARENLNQTTLDNEGNEGLSVVVCHGGEERLPLLAASLPSLRQSRAANEIIVVDMGPHPFAEEIARRWADKYIFVRHNDVFERARSLNIGTALAEYDLVLWTDNDLIMPADFIARAVAEMRSRRLDYLIPYSTISYLSEIGTQAITQSGKDPAGFPLVKELRSLRQILGGIGLVKKSFVASYGGMCEEFRGWGGEDNAWWYKSNLLGRSAATERQDQRAYHLFHHGSGNYGGDAHRVDNPHYPRNLAVLGEMRSIRDRDLFVKRYPPRPLLSCGWEKKSIAFVGESSCGESPWQPGRMAETLHLRFGLKVECLDDADAAHWQDLAARDAIVIFGTDLSISLLTDERYQGLWLKTIVVLSCGPLKDEALPLLRKAGAILCADGSAAETLQTAGLRPWTLKPTKGAPSSTFSAAAALLQPLSIILGLEPSVTVLERSARRSERSTPNIDALKPSATTLQRLIWKTDGSMLPVWMYWEGECPEWIQQCQRTVYSHAADVRLLSPDGFDRLRDTDRDIDLNRLHVTLRADFISAFLLARYGGLWIDSDGIVMKPLQPLLDLLERYDFLAHKDHSGYFCTDFFAARPGSMIASAFYDQICRILRSNRRLGWISLGAEPLTRLLQTTRVAWYEIDRELIKPVRWNDPGAFFATAGRRAHESAFNSRAICYMLSHQQVQGFQARNTSASLLGKETFFSYLLEKALAADAVTAAGSGDLTSCLSSA
ncbi:MAG TPA: glycosyltransferase [Candidatus Angelobacter sp.]